MKVVRPTADASGWRSSGAIAARDVAMALVRGMCSEPSAVRLKTWSTGRFDAFFILFLLSFFDLKYEIQHFHAFPIEL